MKNKNEDREHRVFKHDFSHSATWFSFFDG